MKKIICIGSATKDIFLNLKESKLINNPSDINAQKLMAFEFGAKVYARSIKEMLGGSAVNVAAGLSKAELRAFVFSRIAKGEEGKWITKRLKHLKVKKNYLQSTGGDRGAISVILSDQKNHDHIIFRSGDSVENFNLEKSLKKFREKVHWIYLGSQKQKGEKNMKLVFEFAQQKKAKVAFNPSSWQITHKAKELSGFFDKIEVLFLNRDEALELINNIEGSVEDKPKFLVKRLIDYGVAQVVLTDGAQGAYVGNKDDIFYLPTRAEKIIETVGAGDAFCSGFLANFIETAEIKQALIWGTLNSAGVLSKTGGTEGLLKKKELKLQAKKIKVKIKKI